ncbi:hypothetical protein ROZALSC1DRAFT_26586 [Rozella allomycis CSF55]|uniref:VPS9 domain-containing protein n=1 Tax=Rozella allomycis (strain CSF55) TaxID=988480 RepID=A0A4P9YTB3_ROZAC|nr:hypothetical protein ROZALSC1DRAFT_26586 [Rozella allomycis CSF55]
MEPKDSEIFPDHNENDTVNSSVSNNSTPRPFSPSRGHNDVSSFFDGSVGLKRSVSQHLLDMFKKTEKDQDVHEQGTLGLEQSPSSPIKRDFNAFFQDNSNVINTNTKKMTFENFISILNSPGSIMIARYIKSEFYRRNLSVDEQKHFIWGKMDEQPCWNTDEILVDQSKDYVEKLVVSKIYSRKVYIHQWIDFKHLDINYICDEKECQIACQELQKMELYHAPKDKLTCLLNCCKIIYGKWILYFIYEIIKRYSISSGADDFMPMLIYIVIKGNPPKIVSNINFISRFRHPSRLIEENAYYLTTMKGAIEFIEKINFHSFSNLTEDIYKDNVSVFEEIYHAELKERQMHQLSRSNSINSNLSLKDKSVSPKGAFSQILEKSKNFFSKLLEDDDDYLPIDETKSRKSPEVDEKKSVTPDELDFELQLALALSISENEQRLTEGNADVSLLDTPNSEINYNVMD